MFKFPILIVCPFSILVNICPAYSSPVQEVNSIKSSPEFSIPSLKVDLENSAQHKNILKLLDKLNVSVSEYEENAQPISIESALQRTLSFNPSLDSLRYNILSDYNVFKASKSEWYPQISAQSVNPGYGKVYTNQRTGTYPGQTQEDFIQNSIYQDQVQLAPNLIIAWKFFDLSRQPSINANFQILKQRQYLYAASVRSQLLSVQQDYYSVQASSMLINLYKPLLQNLIREYTVILAKYEPALIDLGSVSQTRAQLFLTLNQMIGYYNDLYKTSSDLANSIGASPDSLFRPNDKLTPTSAWKPSLKQTIIEAEASREEIAAALAVAKSSEELSVSLLNKYFPTFSLVATTGISSTWGSSSNSEYKERQFVNQTIKESYTNRNTSSIGVNFSWSIFDGGKNLFTSKSKKALADKYFSDVSVQRNTVAQQVRTAYSKFLTSQLQLTSASEALKSSKSAQEAALERFRVGVSDITTFIQTIQLYTNAASSYTNALRDYNTSVAQLYRYSSVFPLDSATINAKSLYLVDY